MTAKEWFNKHWPLVLAGAIGLVALILILRRGTSVQTVSVGPSPEAVLQAETQQAQLQAQVAQAYIAGDVAKTQSYYTTASEYYKTYYGAQAAEQVAADQVKIQQSADSASVQRAQISANAQASHDTFSVIGGVLGGIFGLFCVNTILHLPGQWDGPSDYFDNEMRHMAEDQNRVALHGPE